MTEVYNPHCGEPQEATPRLSMSPARRARILAIYDGHCARCEATEGLEIDHAIALELGGDDADPNLVVLCRTCHAEKTRADRAAIAKAARIRRDADPETRRRPKRTIRGRGFQKADPLK